MLHIDLRRDRTGTQPRMNLTLDASRYLIQPIARKPTQVGAVSGPDRSVQHQLLPVSPALEVSADIEYRARQLRRHYFTNDQVSLRTQQAIWAYSSISETEERTRVSTLFGLDEYA